MISSAASNTTTTTTVSSMALPRSSSHLPQPLTSSPYARSPNPMSPPTRPPPIYEPPSTSVSRLSRNSNDLPSTSNLPIQPPSPWSPASTCNPCSLSLNHSPSSLSTPTAPPLVSIYLEKTPNQPLGKGCPPQVINHRGGGTTQRNSATSSHTQFVAYDMIDDFFGSHHTLQSTSNSSKSATKKDDIGRSVPSSCSKPFTITKNLFCYGFLFPPFWILGACFLFIPLPRQIRDAEGTLELDKECSSLQEGLQEERTWGVRCILAALALIVLIIIVAAAVLGSKHVSVNSTFPQKHTSPFVVVG